MKRKIITFAVIGVVVFVFANIFVMYALKPNTNIESAVVQANQLIARVGGTAKVCDEASQMFKRFGVSNQKFFFNASELKDYPAIAGLGTVDRICIYPGSPPHISIRVGTHLDGFLIEIADTNSPVKFAKSPDNILIDSCILVSR